MSNITNALSNRSNESNAALEAAAEERDPARVFLARAAGAIEAALPKHMTADRFGRIMLSLVKTNPDLMNCLNSIEGRATLMGAIMQCAQLGLEPGPLGHAYVLPFDKKEKRGGEWVVKYTEASLVIGYKGLIDLARRSGHIVSIYANEIREADVFTIRYGVNGTLEHVPNWQKSDSPVIGFYAYAELAGGGYQFTVMSKKQVEDHRAQFSKNKSKYNNPWDESFEEMAKKTLIRRLIKVLPMTVDYQSAFISEAQTYALQDAGEVVEVVEVEQPAAPTNQRTTRQIAEPKTAPEPVAAAQEPAQAPTFSRYANWKAAAQRLHVICTAEGMDADGVMAGLATRENVQAVENIETARFAKMVDDLEALSTQEIEGGRSARSEALIDLLSESL